MTNIPLRAYQLKIENLLEDQKTAQALFHCWALLEKFPKCFRVYQIASRALLDIGNLNAAETGFDIVLKINPDDFVAHVGKSVIYESKGLLDEAISHMKFAFEIEPSNERLQSEVRRLLEKKDSVSPNKVILTRGALIKMYMRGMLYEQAIGEIMIGLDESPNRVDFHLALAENLMATGKSIQAAEICIDIIKRLPYCLRANEILYRVFSQEPQSEKNNIYLAHLIELDPYYAFMVPSTKSVLDVPDIAVMIEEKMYPDSFEIPTYWQDFLTRQWNQDTSPKMSVDINFDHVIQNFFDPSYSHSFSSMRIPEDLDKNAEYSEVNAGQNIQKPMDDANRSRRSTFLHKLRGVAYEPRSIADLANNEQLNFQQDINIEEDVNAFINQSLPVEIPREQYFSQDSEEFESAKPPDELISKRDDLNWISIDEGKELDKPINEKPTDQKPAKLNDTQPIQVSSKDPEEIILEAERAITGGNFRYALNLIRPFIERNENLDILCRYLEDAVEEHPDNSSFLLLLGEVYTRMENHEKALAVFQKAQKLITL